MSSHLAPSDIELKENNDEHYDNDKQNKKKKKVRENSDFSKFTASQDDLHLIDQFPG